MFACPMTAQGTVAQQAVHYHPRGNVPIPGTEKKHIIYVRLGYRVGRVGGSGYGAPDALYTPALAISS